MRSQRVGRAAAVVFANVSLVVAAGSGGTLSAAARPAVHASPTPPQAAVINVAVISAERAAATLRALFPHDRVRVDEHANAVLVIAPSDDVQQMRLVVQGIDVRNPRSPSTEVVTLHVLKPQAIVPRLREFYPHTHIEIASKSTLLVRAAPQEMTELKAVLSTLDVSPPTTDPMPKSADAIQLTQTRPRAIALALEREIPSLRASVLGSSVILVGSQDDIAKAKALAHDIDVPPFGAKYTQVYGLHNVSATSVADLIERSFSNLKVTVDKDLNAISIEGTANEQRRIGNAINELDGAQSNGQSSVGAAYGGGNIDVVNLQDAMPGQNGSPSTSAQDIANAVQQALSAMAPDLHVTVPANSSQIILAGNPISIQLAKDLIARLDQPQPLVVLDTEVLEVDENVARNIGLEMPSAAVSSTWQEIQPTPDPFTGESGHIGRLQGLTRTPIQFTAVLNLLVQKGNARVLADPRVTTISGHTASIRAGDTIAILTQTGGGVGTPVTQQIQTFQTGVTLDITPQVGPSGNVVVALHPVVNSLEGILNGVPQIATRDTQTVVQLDDDQTLIIGGLIQENLQRSVSKIPLLGDIPLVGRLFQNSDTQTSRNELVIVVTPHIIKVGAPLVPGKPLLPMPSPQAWPTLPPNTLLPIGALPPPHAEPQPTVVATPVLTTPNVAASPVPMPTPTAFASANTFVFGSPPPNTYAPDTAPPQIYYVQFSPTLLRNGTSVQVSVITSSNVRTVDVGYPGYTTTLSQVAPSKWQATYNFNALGLLSSEQNINLQLRASASAGTQTTVQIPINLIR